MQNSELYELACQCLITDRNNPSVELVKNKFLSGQVNLEKFVWLCSNHLILPAIYLRFQKLGLQECFPTDLQSHLNDILLLNKKRNIEIISQVEEISRELNKFKIEPVYLKGTANLIDNLYSNVGERMIGDIDLLVREKDYFKTAEILKHVGYKQEEVNIFDELNTITHYPRLFRHDVPADVEIHRLPVESRFTTKFLNDNIFEKKLILPNIQNCFVTCDSHKLLHTFIHSQLSNKGYSYRIASLRDLYDFYLISNKIDFYSVLPEIEEKKKAISFFNLAQYMFEPENSPGSAYKQLNSNYVQQFTWFLNHPKQHRLYINSLKAIDIFIERPFDKIKNALFNKSSRYSLIKRLKNPDWYITIGNGIKSHFN